MWYSEKFWPLGNCVFFSVFEKEADEEAEKVFIETLLFSRLLLAACDFVEAEYRLSKI